MLLQLLLLIREPICILLHPLQVHLIGNRGVIRDRDTLLYSRAGIDSFPPFVQVGEFFEIDAGEVGYVDPAVRFDVVLVYGSLFNRQIPSSCEWERGREKEKEKKECT